MSVSADSTPIAPPVTARPPRQWLRWVLGVGLALAGLALAVYLGLDPWLRRQLEQRVATASQGRYRLRIGALHTSLWRGDLQLQQVRLQPIRDARRWPAGGALPRVLTQVGEVRVAGVGLWAAVRGAVVPIDSVVLRGVRLRVLALPAADSAGQPLHARLPAHLDGLAIGYVAVRGLQAAYGAGRQPQASVGRAGMVLRDVRLTAAAARDTTRLAYARTLTVGLQRLAVRDVASHSATLGRGLFSSGLGVLRLDSLRVRSRLAQGPRGRLPRIDLTLPGLALTGVRAAGLARHRLALDSLVLRGPRLTFTPPRQAPPPVYQLLRPVLHHVRLGQVRVTDGWLHLAGVRARPTVQGIALTGSGIVISQPAAHDPARVLYARAWRARTGAATARVSAPVYRGGYGSLDLDTRTGRVQATELYLLPTMSATAVNRYKGYQAPNLTVHLPRLEVLNFDFAALEHRGALLARRLTLRGLHVLLEGDGNFPLNPKPSIVTPERLGAVPLRLNLRRLVIAQARVRSTYRSPSSGRLGTLLFSRLNGTLTNVTNDPRLMSAAHPAVATASGYIADRWRADLKIWLPLLDPAGRHWGQATFGPGSITLLNSMTEPSRNVRFARGRVQRATVRFRADRQRITGTMRAEYSDLKITLLSRKGGADHKTVFTRLGSLLLNGLVVRDENPRRAGGDLKVGEMTSRRERRVSVFSLWRQGLVSGLLHSIGAPKKLAQKISEQQ